MFAIQAFSLCLAFLAYFGGTLASTSCGLPENATSIEVTALVGKNGVSALECWKIHPDFAISPQPGTVGARVQSIGNISGATVVFFDEKNVTFAGLHPAPAPQWVVFISGGGYVQLPANGEVLPIKTGDIIIANDTSSVSPIGHDSTWFPGTVAMQLPFAGGEVNHTVLNDGSCTLNGI